MTGAVDWPGIVKATPRDPYVPQVFWYEDARGRMAPVDRAREPGRWGSGDQAEEFTTWYADGASWASVDFVPGATHFAVAQGGPRSLWDEIAAAYGAWVGDGSPRREQHEVTVTALGAQTVHRTARAT